MAVLQDFFAWLQRLFGGGDLKRNIDAHLAALRARRLGYEDQRRDIEGDIASKDVAFKALDAKVTQFVEEGEGRGAEAIRLGHELDTLKEVIADLQLRSGNRRALETLLRRVTSAGEELRDFLPQQPDLAKDLEENLRMLVQQAQTENAEALGRLLSFLERKLKILKDTIVREQPDREVANEELPETTRQKLREKDARDRAELDDAEEAGTPAIEQHEQAKSREMNPPEGE